MAGKKIAKVAIDKLSHEVRAIMLQVGMDVLEQLADKIAEEANSRAPTIEDRNWPLAPGQETRRGPDKKGKSSSGPIRGSIFAQEGHKVPYSYLVVSPAWYSHFYEYGTVPHSMPKGKKKGNAAMVYRDKHGKIVKAKYIEEHPGAKKRRPFMRPSADRADQFARAILRDMGLL